MLRRTALIALLAALSGCASIASRLHGSLTPPPGQAYAIVSLVGKAFDPDRATIGLTVSDAQGRPAAQEVASLLTDTVFGEQGMSEGKLALLTLPPGDYRLSGAWAHWVEEGAFGAEMKMKQFRLDAPFRLAPNETVYLGEVWMDLSFLPEVQLRDERGRDFSHMRRVWKIDNLDQVRLRPLAQTAPVQP
ncbi:hypothetical protein [Chromobacterium paludis]|uniref:Carboxypeptidase regulatory-like domain-containing protein n=1 Tax=Chromobacterium paludis TaxID=2605945 RepID=A0A5C1DIQ4_9NEIS|nr:hypothetical protein [Chromobacterium paludis]QEL55927.1 hypothetical protein FYK34_10350 [Chromobacterium paludis]